MKYYVKVNVIKNANLNKISRFILGNKDNYLMIIFSIKKKKVIHLEIFRKYKITPI